MFVIAGGAPLQWRVVVLRFENDARLESRAPSS
jgi:hypothetical protein